MNKLVGSVLYGHCLLSRLKNMDIEEMFGVLFALPCMVITTDLVKFLQQISIFFWFETSNQEVEMLRDDNVSLCRSVVKSPQAILWNFNLKNLANTHVLTRANYFLCGHTSTIVDWNAAHSLIWTEFLLWLVVNL